MSSGNLQGKWSAETVVGGRYRLERQLGVGAMAEVWKAEHVTLQTPVAVKLINIEDDSRAEETLERFVREGQAAAKLRSPHVVQVLDHGLEGGYAYMAMQLLHGESMRKRLTRQPQLPPVDVARVVSQLARGLDAAHKAGIVHRDLKPQNIFLAKDEDREVIKIVDFGIAKRTDLKGIDRLSTQDGLMVGTPCYMSPEQVMGVAHIDTRSDLWQVAVVTFECLCGQRPFDNPAVAELMMSICSRSAPVPSQVAEVPAGFDSWFARATNHEPAGRFQSALEMAEALCAVLAPHTSAAALADSLPMWTPPAAGSSPGLLYEQTFSGTHSSTGRNGWAAQHGTGRGLTQRRALITAALVALPVAVFAAVAGIWLLSPSGSEEEDGPAAEPTTETSAPVAATDGAASAEAEPPPSASTTTEASAPPDESAIDAGVDASVPSKGQVPAKQPRRPRPEDVLGI